MTEPSTDAKPDIAAPLLKQSQLVDLTSEGPSLLQTALLLLQRELQKNYPKLNVDPDKAMIATPLRDEAGTWQFQSLTHALTAQAFGKKPAAYLDGESFLTLTPHAQTPLHLAIDMDDVNVLLNDHAPFLFVAFQQSQLDYWNDSVNDQPRWQKLSNAFKAAVDVTSANGWEADECTLARLVAAGPDKALRTVADKDFKDVRACLLDIDRGDGATTQHLITAGALVMTATHKARELIVLYTIGGGYESFDSMAKLGESLPAHLGPEWNDNLQWRLIEPEGNIFDAVVWALVATELDAIAALDPASTTGVSKHQRSSLGTLGQQRFDQLNQSIPDWLQKGSINDLRHYSHYIGKLGTLRAEAEKDVFKEDDLTLIKPYAHTLMREAIVTDKGQESAASLPWDSLRITVTNSFEAGGLTLPNPHDQYVETLAEFALQNTPPYMASLAFEDDSNVPAWLTVDYLTTMAQQVNVGEHYPKLLKQTLIDDPVKAALRKTRFTSELPLLLPLMALECKLRAQGNVDAKGYACVRQLMDSLAQQLPQAKSPVTIRPLAFIPRNRLSKKADTVSNMFIIGPRDPDQGPCLLYRPMLDTPLRQFASQQNLMYALYQPGELRDSVLAWLDNEALSFEYAQYVFAGATPSLWVVTQLAFEPLIHLDLAGPIDLANTPLTGEILQTLYDANSTALTQLAERQSVSNSERRWALLADSGWALFDVASNFFSGAPGAAVWVWQSIGAIQKAIDAHEKGDKLVEWKSTGDVLLVLGIILLQHVTARRNHSSPARLEAPKFEAEEDVTPVTPAKPSVLFDNKRVTEAIPVGHLSSLEPDTLVRSDTSQRFIALMESFKMPAPDLATHSISPSTHLYEVAGKTCAQVGTRWFQVVAMEGEPTYIVDPASPERTGLALKYDTTSAAWHWDLKLRLRGGGPKGRIDALRRAREQKKEQAWAKLQPFLSQEKQKRSEVSAALRDLPTGPSETEFSAKAMPFMEKSLALGKGYTEALGQLQEWNAAGGDGVFYQNELIRLTGEQHRCLGPWLRVKLRAYLQVSEKLLPDSTTDAALTRTELIDVATRTKALSDEMIAVLLDLHRSLDVLNRMGGSMRRAAARLAAVLPKFTRLDLLANEIGMSQELCLLDRPEAEMGNARAAITTVTNLAATASHDLIALLGSTTSDAGKAERIEQLSRVNDVYTGVDELIVELPTTFPERFDQARLNRVRELITEFHTLARDRLVEELPEPDETLSPPTPEPGPSTAQPKSKPVKSRPRQSSGQKDRASNETDAIDEPAFVKVSRPPSAPAPQSPVSDIDLIAAALNLSEGIDDFNKNTSADAKRPGRIPADIRDMFEQQAAKLEKTADDVDTARANRRAKGEEPLPVALLTTELRDGAARTRRQGIASYAAMLKIRKPREAYFLWLAKNAQVEIIKDTRGRILTKQRKDYFQEYRILDKSTNKPLWVAHFHYASLKEPDEQFTVAHLKFADAYLQTVDANKRQAMETFDAVDNALRRIVDPVARDLFLKLQDTDEAR